MQKIDLKKELKYLYAPPAKAVQLVEVPELQFAMIDGVMETGTMPGTSAGFQQAVQALYGVSYTLKFSAKKREVDPVDYPVMALEGLWSVQEGEFDITRPGNWAWTLMILHPAVVTAETFEEARQQLGKKHPSPAVERLRLERFQEGLCMQTMHIGPYANEPQTVERMKAFAAENGLAYRGRHHEIYMGDPRQAAPEKLKTILRQPVSR